MKFTTQLISMVCLGLICSSAFAIRGGFIYPYQQLSPAQKYPQTQNKPCTPYDKRGCVNIEIQRSNSPVKLEAYPENGSVIKIEPVQ